MSNDGIKFNLSFEVSKGTLRDILIEARPKDDNPLYGELYKWMMKFLTKQSVQYMSTSGQTSSTASKCPDMYGAYFNEDGTLKMDNVFKLYSQCTSNGQCTSDSSDTTKEEAKEETKEEQTKEDTKEKAAKDENIKTTKEENKEETKEEETKASTSNQNLFVDFVKLWSTCAATGTVEPSEVIGLVARTSEYLNSNDRDSTSDQILEDTLEETFSNINGDNTPPFEN